VSTSRLWNSSNVSTKSELSFAPVYSHSPGSVVLGLLQLWVVLVLLVVVLLLLLLVVLLLLV
jgi:hypothetical protein